MKATALREFQRLEAQGSWRSSPDAQLREVIVSIGEATLILSDPKSESPLAHWSLPAVQRLNPGKMPAQYSPASAGQVIVDTLEIDDTLMVNAIGRVQAAVQSRRSHPGRVRATLTLVLFAGILLAGVLWLPNALREHAVRITPAAEQQRIGLEILENMQRATGPVCRNPEAAAALGRLARRLTLADRNIVIVRDGISGALALPGGLIVVDAQLINDQPGPEALAGHVLAADAAARDSDPLRETIKRLPFPVVAKLLTRGNLPDEALARTAEDMLANPVPLPSDGELLRTFAKAKIPSTPFALSLRDMAGRAIALSEGDPFRTAAYPPVLSDADWIAVEQVCD